VDQVDLFYEQSALLNNSRVCLAAVEGDHSLSPEDEASHGLFEISGLEGWQYQSIRDGITQSGHLLGVIKWI